jgi:hypothetical protein
MTEPGDRRRPEDGCLERTAERLDFTGPTADEAAAAAERRVDPLRRVLRNLLRARRR